MDIQLLIVGLIILAACFYIGRLIFLKAKSTVSKKSCGADCGCDASSPQKISPIQIKKRAQN